MPVPVLVKMARSAALDIASLSLDGGAIVNNSDGAVVFPQTGIVGVL